LAGPICYSPDLAGRRFSSQNKGSLAGFDEAGGSAPRIMILSA